MCDWMLQSRYVLNCQQVVESEHPGMVLVELVENFLDL